MVKKVDDSDKDGVKKALGVMQVSIIPKPEVTKAEKQLVEATHLTYEDAFEELYFDASTKTNAKIIRPPYNFLDLEMLAQQNNSLNQCVTAYEVNIDGTGWEIAGTEDEDSPEPSDQDISDISDFFNEPNPRESFVTIRRALRRDIENIGNAYLEVLRSLDGEIAFMRRVIGSSVRLVKRADPIMVDVNVRRRGKDMTVKMPVRERAYAQMVGTRVMYFKDYGASRDLNRWTGEWAERGTLPAGDRASELIHFTAQPDTKTGYGVPRWINQIPSVLGSRKAEELNLDFFNAGGLPPALIILQGGTLAAEVRKELEAYLSGKGSSKNRAAVIETTATGGSLDSAGSVRVTVERFGADRQKDSMFENYDERSEKRVRSSFRLPPLFVGRTDDYTFASAFASYMVAEAQVFVPEREEFDERMNVTIMKELDPTGNYMFRSLPMSVKNTENQLKALEILATKGAIGNIELVRAMNEIVNMNIEEPEEDEAEDDTDTETTTPGEAPPAEGSTVGANPPIPPANEGGPTPPAGPSQKAEGLDTFELVALAGDYAGVITGEKNLNRDQVSALSTRIKSLSPADRERFDAYVTLKAMGGGYDHDPEGATELCSCAAEILTADGS